MNVYLEDLMTSNAFLGFEIGRKLDLSSFVVGDDYNRIGKTSGYNFFNKEVSVEVTEMNGLIHSFDVILRNQENELYLGTSEGYHFNISKCTLDSFITYLNKSGSEWTFGKVSEKSLSIVCFSKLRLIFHFDCESNPSLSLIHIYKEPE